MLTETLTGYEYLTLFTSSSFSIVIGISSNFDLIFILPAASFNQTNPIRE